jgi:hypothetical protein
MRKGFNHKAPSAVKLAGIVDGISDESFIIGQSSPILARPCEAQPTEWQRIGNQIGAAFVSRDSAPLPGSNEA